MAENKMFLYELKFNELNILTLKVKKPRWILLKC